MTKIDVKTDQRQGSPQPVPPSVFEKGRALQMNQQSRGPGKRTTQDVPFDQRESLRRIGLALRWFTMEPDCRLEVRDPRLGEGQSGFLEEPGL